MDLLEIKLDSAQSYASSSDKISVIAGKKYVVTTEFIGIRGEQFCGYFGVAILDQNNIEIDRKIRWLNDFTSKKKIASIVFHMPPASDSIQFIYRINDETPVKASCHYLLLSPYEILSSETDAYVDENYSTAEEYILPQETELSLEQELILEQNLVWVFSSPRSGTTWLATQLLSHNTRIINEPLIGLHLGAVNPFTGDNHVRYIDIYKYDYNYFFSIRYSSTWKFYLRKLILNRIHAQIKDLSKTVIIKEPNGSYAADVISDCLPNSKIIVLLRDGRDVVDSMVDALQPNSWGIINYNFTHIPKENRLKFIVETSGIWVKLTKLIMKTYDRHSKELCLLLKYEDLLKSTIDELRKIYYFVGVRITEHDLQEIVTKYKFESIPNELKGKGKWTRFASPGKWKENFEDTEVEEMEKILIPTLKDLGYV